MTLAFTVLYFYLLRLRGRVAALQEAREEREFESVSGEAAGVVARG